MAAVDNKKCRHLKMQIATRLVCRLRGLEESGPVLARWFERTMGLDPLSERGHRLDAALHGTLYSPRLLAGMARHVPEVRTLVDHPFWPVLDLKVAGARADTLLDQCFPGWRAVGAAELHRQLARRSDLDRLTVLLLLSVCKPHWSLAHPGAIAGALTRLCAGCDWYPVRYRLASLLRAWLVYMHGQYCLAHWFCRLQELDVQILQWQALHDLSWATPLVRNELDWRAFSEVFSRAAKVRQAQIYRALESLDDQPGSIFHDADLWSAYRCRCGLTRRWSAANQPKPI
ncbi:hypothetical protein BMS17_21900 [Pseudomonas sp. C9]|nr:hypothetical protein BMS17_21900 [Pseudomonas sp. C9]